MLSVFIDLLPNSGISCREKVLIKKVGRAVKTELVNYNLPACERKMDVLTNLLSHLLTNRHELL